MHDCPDCGEACACDIEDVYHDEAPEDCAHICSLDEDDEDFGGSEE